MQSVHRALRGKGHPKHWGKRVAVNQRVAKNEEQKETKETFKEIWINYDAHPLTVAGTGCQRQHDRSGRAEVCCHVCPLLPSVEDHFLWVIR